MEDFDTIAYDKAKRKVKEIKGFYVNLACYLMVLPIIIYLNLKYTPEFHWFWFSMAGWGIGVVSHGMGAFGYYPFLGRDWEDKKLKELMNKMEKKDQEKTKYQ